MRSDRVGSVRYRSVGHFAVIIHPLPVVKGQSQIGRHPHQCRRGAAVSVLRMAWPNQDGIGALLSARPAAHASENTRLHVALFIRSQNFSACTCRFCLIIFTVAI